MKQKYANPEVSVVIPTYDRGEYLKNAIESVLTQTTVPHEVIVIDDASPSDDALEVCQGFNSPLIIFKKHRTRKGGNGARNTGISISSGTHIAFLDDDDLWLPQKLEKQLKIFDQDSRIGAVYCGIGSIDLDTGKVHPFLERKYPAGDLYRTLLVHDVTAGTPAYVVDRRCFDRVGLFDETLQARQDWDMWIRISEHYMIAPVSEVLVLAGEHSGVRARYDIKKSIAANRLIYCKYKGNRQRFGFSLRQRAKAALLCTEGNVYSLNKTKDGKAFSSYIRGILTWPFYPGNFKGVLRTMWRFINK